MLVNMLFEQFPHLGYFDAQIFELVAHVALHGPGLFGVGVGGEKNADGFGVGVH